MTLTDAARARVRAVLLAEFPFNAYPGPELDRIAALIVERAEIREWGENAKVPMA